MGRRCSGETGWGAGGRIESDVAQGVCEVGYTPGAWVRLSTGRCHVDFFEQWFHVDPNHGNGSLEALIIVAAIVLVLTLLFRRQLGGLLRRPRRR